MQTGSDYVPANGGTWWRFTVGADTSEPGSGTASVTREYIYLGSMLLASIESGSTLTYYHADALGSVRAITSASGSTLSRVDYAPFGENTGSLSGDPRKFIGGEQDAETAFDNLGARYYRNVSGRFTSVDPVFSAGALTNPQLWNRYSYGLNSPLRFSDPTGMAPQDDRPVQDDSGGPNCSLGSCQSLTDFTNCYFMASKDHTCSEWIALGRPYEGWDNPEQSCDCTIRSLTADEVAAAYSVFGGSINYAQVKIKNYNYIPFQDVPMTPNGSIYWPANLDNGNCADFTKCGKSALDDFIHEMTHVYQYQNGVPVLVRGAFTHLMAAIQGFDPYDLPSPIDPTRPWDTYGLEV